MEPYKIILVDDHSLFRNGLRGLLERCAACRVVGEAASGEEFLAMLGGVDKKTLRKWARAGRIKMRQPSGYHGKVMVSVASIEEFDANAGTRRR